MEDHFLLPQSKFEELRGTLNEIKDSISALRIDPAPLGDWITEHDAKKLLGLKETSLWSLRKRKMVTFSKVGAKLFYSRKSIEKLITKHEC